MTPKTMTPTTTMPIKPVESVVAVVVARTDVAESGSASALVAAADRRAHPEAGPSEVPFGVLKSKGGRSTGRAP